MERYPQNVGILAMEIYFPRTSISQEVLEKSNNVSPGKYTIGLGQLSMSFIGDREDINSICLTVLNNLLEKHNIDPRSVGRLEVGTETIIDKSKSTKTYLMDLFKNSKNMDIEGLDCKNACYGGTNAIFNSLNWIESSAWDGRYAIVVTGDVAVYEDGPARPTGGAGAVAILLGPDAPLVFDRKVRSTYMDNTYDFYKPDHTTEYPIVDGQLSNKCYLQALDNCYRLFCKKWKNFFHVNFSLDEVDHVCFHSPYNKLVQKSLARLFYNDALAHPDKPEFAGIRNLFEIPPEETYTNPEFEVFLRMSKPIYEKKVLDGTLLPKKLGNLYCASLYSSLISLIAERKNDLIGKRILLFSYGSGLASSLFTLTVKKEVNNVIDVADLTSRLDSRIFVDASFYNAKMKLTENHYKEQVYTPEDPISTLHASTWYLTHVDSKKRRYYSKVTAAKI